MVQHLRAAVAQLASPVRSISERARAELISAGAAAVPLLVHALSDAERDTRGGAAICLSTLKAPAAVPALALAAWQDPDAGLRAVMLRALAESIDPTATQAVLNVVVALLRDTTRDPLSRELACVALGKTGSAFARTVLQETTGDGDDVVKTAAHRALVALDLAGRPASAASPTPAIPPAAVAAAALTDASQPDAPNALVARTDVVTVAAAELGSPDPARQQAARGQLVAHGEPSLAALFGIATNPLAPGRRLATEIIGQIGAQAGAHSGAHSAARLLAELIATEEDTASPVLPVALHALTQLAIDRQSRRHVAPEGDLAISARAISSMQVAVRSPDPLLRAAACAALIAVGSVEDRAGALHLALADPDDWVTQSAARALAGVAGPRDLAAAEDLATHLPRFHNHVEIHRPLLRALTQILPSRAHAQPMENRRILGDAVSFYVHSDDEAVRLAATLLLTRLSDRLDRAAEVALHELVVADGYHVPELILAIARVGRGENAGAALDALAALEQHAATKPTTATALADALVLLDCAESIGRLAELANHGAAALSDAARRAVEQLDPRARHGANCDDGGRFAYVERLFCAACDSGPLSWKPTDDGREALTCERCGELHLLPPGGKVMRAAHAPFGSCLCAQCRRRQPLVRAEQSDTLICPVTRNVHIRPFDKPNALRLLAALPFGACTCCAEPQPLLRVNESVVCYRSRKPYRAAERGFVLDVPLPAGMDDAAAARQVDAINAALLAGSISIGDAGLPLVAPRSDEESDE